MRRFFFVLALAIALNNAAVAASDGAPSGTSPTETSLKQANSMKIRLIIQNTVLTATLIDSKTARDFVSLLPLTVTMDDLFGREKFGHLPRAISEGGERTRKYEIGDIAYWSPGPDVAIYYRHGGESIPAPGIIVIGKIDSGVDTLNIVSEGHF
jgi:hypothetical protein